jgi:hypothetical protein
MRGTIRVPLIRVCPDSKRHGVMEAFGLPTRPTDLVDISREETLHQPDADCSTIVGS